MYGGAHGKVILPLARGPAVRSPAGPFDATLGVTNSTTLPGCTDIPFPPCPSSFIKRSPEVSCLPLCHALHPCYRWFALRCAWRYHRFFYTDSGKGRRDRELRVRVDVVAGGPVGEGGAGNEEAGEGGDRGRDDKEERDQGSA